MPRCEATNPIDRHMQCTGEGGHEGSHRLGGIGWSDSTTTYARGFWSQDATGRDFCCAIAYGAHDVGVVWDALRRARAFVIEREHDDARYKGRFVRGWSEEDGFFWTESADEEIDAASAPAAVAGAPTAPRQTEEPG